MVLLTWFIFAKVDVDGAGLRGASEAPEGEGGVPSGTHPAETLCSTVSFAVPSSTINTPAQGFTLKRSQNICYGCHSTTCDVDFVDCKWQSCDAESTEIGDFN